MDHNYYLMPGAHTGPYHIDMSIGDTADPISRQSRYSRQ